MGKHKDITKLKAETALKNAPTTYADRKVQLMLEALIECDWRLTAAGKLVGCNRITMRRWRDRFVREGYKVRRYTNGHKPIGWWNDDATNGDY